MYDRFSLDQTYGLIVTNKNCTVTVFNVHAPTSATFSDTTEIPKSPHGSPHQLCSPLVTHRVPLCRGGAPIFS